ncbi:YdhR family protein [Enterovirga rhinocerotis]|uniref:Putative monooxygenase ydhR n=1 Tax=Enterovirga rhinocerotis TaxID=1339210 RepID=A0A4R7BKZ4_9HYPH|nr:YdhR family protein [Enterovirga rhinocerotis]TDR85272.1 putative monooxygenase ydhR [Enterovirga rhinocerotis]
MTIILQVNYRPSSAQAAAPEPKRIESARRIADTVGGLHWKVWIGSQEDGLRGGIYLFSDRASAEAWAEQDLRPRLTEGGGSDILIRYFEVDEALSRITRAPIEPARVAA